MFLPNLTTNVMYEVKIRGATRSLFSPSKIYPGLFSESRKIFVALDCDRLSLSHVQSGSEIFSQEIELSAGMVAAMVCASFALVLVILAFVLWRKYFQVLRYLVCCTLSVLQLLPFYYARLLTTILMMGLPLHPR
jgi:receptor-type tyrosine-protein phosphatase gamma